MALLIVCGGALWAFNHGPTPKRWLAALTASLTEQLGAEVSIESVRLAGVDRITLHGVRIEGDVPVEARRVVAAFSVGELWRQRVTPLAALRWVSVEGWQVELPADTLDQFEWLAGLLSDGGEPSVGDPDAETQFGKPDEEPTVSGPKIALAALTEALLGHEWVDGTLDVYLRGGRIAVVHDESPPAADGADMAASGGSAAQAQADGTASGRTLQAEFPAGDPEFPAGDPELLLQVNGALALGHEQLVVRNVRVELADWQTTVNGAALPRPDLYVHATGRVLDDGDHGDSPVRADRSWLGQDRPPFRFSGTVQSEMWLTGHWDAPNAWGTGHIRAAEMVMPDHYDDAAGAGAGNAPERNIVADAESVGNAAAAGNGVARGSGPESAASGPIDIAGESVAEVGVAPDSGIDPGPVPAPVVYSADDVAFQWSYRPGHSVDVRLDATRGGARINIQGDVAADGSLDLAVVAANVRVPEDLPPLGQWDVSGRIDVDGTLRGTLAAPVLRADVASDGGYLFGQPFSTLQGYMRLTQDDFAFERVRVTQGTADYYLDGALAFTEPMHMDLTLRTDNGRAEALTAVLGWDIPVHSGLAGTLRFAGPLGDVAAEGEIAFARGSAWEQPFDSVTGRFRYGGGEFAVSDVTGVVRGGTVTASGGSIDPIAAGADAGGWQFDVVVSDVPIQAAPVLRELVPMVSGVLDFVGTVSNDGKQWNPRVEGNVAGRHLLIGSFDFVDATGDIAWLDGALSSTGFTLQRRDGGVYDVTGHVHDVLDAPRLDVAITVQGESVGQLLALTDWRLPLLAHSDPVRAEVILQGTPDDPEANIRVESDAVYVVGRPLPLALDLRLKDGRLEVERLSGPAERG